MSTAADALPDGRDETENERLDRNWQELLQELRVIQTGTQILTGFLLTLAFQPRFADLDAYQVSVYLTLVAFAAIATILALAPVSLHRVLFRKRAKADVVRVAHRVLALTLVAVAATLAGTVMLIFDVVLGREAGWVAAAVAVVLAVTMWLIIPLSSRRQHNER
ncbi:amino acid transporter [Microbacteriaceae bacterium SG_E_30_P1]|uniref:Amino acid transporter n=1 Tax=Antiquaquibacter oligotrophicus TaxID=2880260 RepID=A0ABT6KKX6_9MICO|nr:DUF6328 family protein [Antiquaquibacter oligotrophicus]MDH6180643.1 amino acid transporter [Antiquaquibacter oligotrophicus]UDF13628.1 DUF6328 family protein [Antiquaquibacter oligotrophicus]